MEYFAVPIDRVQMVHNLRMVRTSRFRHGRAVWAPANRLLVGGRIPRLVNNFSLGFAGIGPSFGIPVSAGVSTPLHDSTSGQVHFSGDTRRALDFSGEGMIIEIAGAILGMGGNSLQILLFDAPHTLFGGSESIVRRVREAMSAYHSSGGNLLSSLQSFFLNTAISFISGNYSGAGLGITLYLGRFGGISEVGCGSGTSGQCAPSVPYDG
jgi:hypothetical protein